MYLFLKLVALGIIRLFPASQPCGGFEFVYSKCWRNGQFVGVFKTLAYPYTRDVINNMRVIRVCVCVCLCGVSIVCKP